MLLAGKPVTPGGSANQYVDTGTETRGMECGDNDRINPVGLDCALDNDAGEQILALRLLDDLADAWHDVFERSRTGLRAALGRHSDDMNGDPLVLEVAPISSSG